jgi:hypothetical protein
LDEHQVRTWTSWHRWVTLAMLALAFLTVAALAEHAQPPPPGMIPLTHNEIAHLAVALLPRPLAARAIGPTGPTGAAATNTMPGPATTGGKPSAIHEANDLRLGPLGWRHNIKGLRRSRAESIEDAAL